MQRRQESLAPCTAVKEKWSVKERCWWKCRIRRDALAHKAIARIGNRNNGRIIYFNGCRKNI
ncbi:hypothetical protein PSCICN_07500 [Pseudomonas cichorii]|nr:hypothetical protein PSCICN_07500 [Pseudomonas cichorii]